MSRGALASGRAAFDTAFDKEAWTEVCAALTVADQESPLGPEDLDRLATAAYLIGEDTVSAQARSRAHSGFLERGEPIRAARSAFWLAFAILDNPREQAQAAGWLARARRILDECGADCVEQGFLLCTQAYRKVVEGDVAAAEAAFNQAVDIGVRFRDPDVTTLARHGQGRVLLRRNKTSEGFALLDEVMVAITSGEVGPIIAGVVYCSVIGACFEVFDFGRAREWTTALSGWCASHPDMVPFRGQCLVRRSELMQLHGEWSEASREAQRASEWLARSPTQADAGAAYYQQGELYRLSGDFANADDAYQRASQAGRKPYPGLALLRLAQGQGDAADAAVRRLLQETRDRRLRARALGACVEIMLAKPDLSAARAASDELAAIANDVGATSLRAAAAQAAGAVALEAGEAETSVDWLRQALTSWQQLDVPYETARVRALIGRAYRRLGDEHGAQMEFDAAQEIFDRLGARPDSARTLALAAAAPLASGGLTGREVEVLRLIATGKTNRAIAQELTISEKTVARHLSNIFTKLDLPSRSAATAYAYQHKLI